MQVPPPAQAIYEALILEWKKTNAGLWSAPVVYVPNARGSRSVEAWFAEHLLKPIDHTSGATDLAGLQLADGDGGRGRSWMTAAAGRLRSAL